MDDKERKIAIVLVIIIIVVFVFHFMFSGSNEGFRIGSGEYTNPQDGIVEGMKENARGRRNRGGRRSGGGRGGNRGGRRGDNNNRGYAGSYGAGWSVPGYARRRYTGPVYRSGNYYSPAYYYPVDYYPVTNNVFDCMDSCRFRYDRVPCINACRRIYGV